MIPVVMLLLLAALHTTTFAQRFGLPKPVEPETPSIPKPNDPIVPPHIGPLGVPDLTPKPPPQQQLQQNLGRLEEKLEHVQDGVDVVTEVVNAILTTPTITIVLGATVVLTSSASNVTVTPTSTLPASSFLPCSSYARTLDHCFSSTSNFYSLAPTDQVSCACYSTVYAETISCGPSSTQVAAIPTLAASNFDALASSCYDFFRLEGYAKAAKAMDAKSGNGTVVRPGRGFCAGVDEELKEASGKNGTMPVGLASTLKPSPYGQCMAVSQQTSGSTDRVAGVTGLDRTILVTAPFIIGLITYLAFS